MTNRLVATLLLSLFGFTLPAIAGTTSEWVSFTEIAGVSKADFVRVLRVMEDRFQAWAQRDGRELEIMSDWNADWAQAFARRWETDQVIVYGGIARIPNATTDSLALILCHELGHLYGGIPFSDEHNRLSVEGQADYFATSECWDLVIDQLPVLSGSSEERAVNAALVVTAFFASNRNQKPPRLETPDTTVVATTLKTHPEPQCRLDTYIAGLEKTERPRCWWAPENED